MAGGWSGIIGTLGGAALGSMLGGNAPTTTPYSGAVNSGATSLNNLGVNTSGLGSSLLNQGTQLTPEMTDLYQKYISSLGQNPYTSSFMTGQLAGTAADAATNLAGGQAQLTDALSQRGLAQPGGGASSPLASGLTALQSQSINTNDAARNKLAEQSYQQMLQNQGLAAQASGQLQGNLVNQGNQTISNGANISQMSQQDLINLMQSYLQQQQMNNSQQNGLGSGLGSILTNGASLLGL